MAELVLPDLETEVLSRLQSRATQHGRTAAEEATAILTAALSERQAEAWAPVDSIFGQLAASGRTFGDSAALLREDRRR